MKAATWDSAISYDIHNYLKRASGSDNDNSALVWSCQVREQLRQRTGQSIYMRPGDMWIRNQEFGQLHKDFTNPR